MSNKERQQIIGPLEVLCEATEALLVLIPKNVKPINMKGFRPLSHCNSTTYKLLSKVIANRLKEVMRGLISLYQASFVPGRPSLENVIHCQEHIHSFRYKRA